MASDRESLNSLHVELPSSVLEVLKLIVDNEMKKNNIPGVSIAIVYDKEIIWSDGYGYADLENKILTTPKTIFAVGSITKLVTAIMMMRLRDEGKLSLDDAVEKFIPTTRIRSSSNNDRPVTLRQIASHTAGLQREVSFDTWHTLKFPSIEELVDSLRDVTTVFPPFSRYKYSNLGYTILGHVLSIVAGLPYKEYVISNILKPLGMNQSKFDLTDDVKLVLAKGYTVFGDEPIELVPYIEFGAMAPAGQLFSSVQDIANLISLQFLEDRVLPMEGASIVEEEAEEQIKSQSILDPATIREMHSPVYIGKKWVGGTAIGWHITNALGHTISSHRGGIPGFTTDIVVVRDIKLGIAVFTNAFPQPNEIAVCILETLIPYFETFETVKGEQVRQSKLEHDSLEKFTGKYHSKYFGDIEIKLLDGRLLLTDPLAPPGLETVLIPLGPQKFMMSGGDEDGEFALFEASDDGTIKSINTAGYRFDLVKKL